MKSKMNRFARLGALAALMTCAGVGLPARGQQLASPPDNELSALAVQRANSAEFDGKTLTLHGVPTTIWFGYRPEHRAGVVDAATYVKAWQAGGAFADDPPNAVLSFAADGVQEVVIVLNSAETSGDDSFRYAVEIVRGATYRKRRAFRRPGRAWGRPDGGVTNRRLAA